MHEGFQAALSHVQSAVDSALDGISPQGELLITGHSLGAGLATLLAAQLRVRHPRLITFGSPRVGDARFASLIDATSVARIVNCCDVVTRIPPEAFDARHIDELLAELGVPSLLSHGLAAVLSLLLGAGGLSAHFEHIAPPLYVNGAGTVDSQITDSGMIKDRTSARERYRQSHPVAAMDWDAVLAAVRHLTELVGRKQPLRQAVGQQGTSLSFLKIGSQVPLRDLSDHAPVNYVSAMVRSFRSAGAKPGPPRPSSTGTG